MVSTILWHRSAPRPRDARGPSVALWIATSVDQVNESLRMKVFHTFRLDSLNQCLWHGDRRVTTTPKAFEVLRYLVEHPGRLVTQEEILEAVWPKAYVNQEVVKKYILGVRKVLGDRHHEPLFIETLPRRGYQFIAPVLEEDSAAPEPSAAPGRSRIVGRDDV